MKKKTEVLKNLDLGHNLYYRFKETLIKSSHYAANMV